jgi:Tol biopolymer transport system component
VRFPATAACLLFLAASAAAQSLTKLSVGPSGTAANAGSSMVELKDCLSPDGRFVLFVSSASNLVTGDTNGFEDIFVHDTLLGTTTLESRTSSGGLPNANSLGGALSDDGRWVAFQSTASNVTPLDTNGTIDVFLRDRQAGTTTLVSASPNGTSANNSSASPSISSDGSRVAFVSAASNLVAGDTNGVADIFVRDLPSATIWLVSKLPSGTLPNANSTRPMLSGDGQFVAYNTTATNLVGPHPVPGAVRVLLSAVPTGFVEEVSVNTAGQPANGYSVIESISRDGQRLLFQSTATNLGPVLVSNGNLFLRDRASGTSTLVTRLASGLPANGQTSSASISSNGQYALLASNSSDLTVGHLGFSRDAFVVHLDTLAVARVSAPLTLPGEPNLSAVIEIGEVSDDGLRATFLSGSYNLIPGEPVDSIADIYLAQASGLWQRDADGDGWGDPNVTSNQTPPAAGFVSTALDCDDTNAAVHPGALELCNGFDDDCDGVTDPGAYVSYCVTAASYTGCVPSLSAAGFAGASATSGFTLSAGELPGARHACLFYGFGATQISLAIGSHSAICVQAPRVRTVLAPTGGMAGTCAGNYSLDWLAWMAQNPTAPGHPLVPGQTLFAQIWYRDPGAVLNTNTTDAVQFLVCP